MNSNQLSDLLACLYRAPLEGGGWQEFLDRLAVLTGASGGGFLQHDLVHRKFSLRAVVGPQGDPAIQQAYNTYYGPLDPWRDPYLALGTDEAVLPGHALVPVEDLRKTEIYNDLLLPNGVVHPVILPGIVSPVMSENITMWWSEQSGPPDEEVIDFLQMLRPHLKSSLQTLHALDESRRHAHSAQAALDHMHQAVFVLGETLELQHSNGAAEHLLQRAEGVSRKGRRLVVAAPLQGRFDAALQCALLHAQADPSAKGDGMETLSLPGPNGKRTLPTRVMPLRIESAARPAHVLVLVSDTARTPSVSLESMRSLFAATPTEVAIANGLLAGRSVAEIARTRRISEDTTRSHLKTLFQRTGTGRQSELVLLLLSLPRTWSDASAPAGRI